MLGKPGAAAPLRFGATEANPPAGGGDTISSGVSASHANAAGNASDTSGSTAGAAGHTAAEGAASGAKGGKPIGLGKVLWTLWHDVSHAENRQFVRGMLIWAASLPLALVPVAGWAAAWIGTGVGEKMMQSAGGRGSGPLQAFRGIQAALNNREPVENVMKLGCDFVDQLITENDSHAAAARDRLKQFIRSRGFDWVHRVYRARSSNMVRLLNRGARIPFRPISLPMRLLSYLIQALHMLVPSGAARKAATGALRAAARKI